ncbi:MAG: hypothetical protein KDJ19_10765 [Hyphomicrobiaceae bacterium]|nr:hypothetical protein [Hyphomicrobiaceae bacterium]MCC0023862.1 hypothetical protein [Hyphomicrobiaceae bacterium]
MTWKPRPKDIKSYLHFDADISESDLVAYVTDPTKVLKHPFFPLIRFYEKWEKFPKKGQPRKTKVRPLRYAARKDAAIFAYYRTVFSKYYEEELERRGISTVPIAYRKIRNFKNTGKCNIDFAKDAFDFIREIGDADVTVVDISSYFENLDHAKIRHTIELVLHRPLAPHEEAVLKALTNYCVVDRDAVYDRLGMFEKGRGTNRKEKRQRKIDKLRASRKRQMCTPNEFREKICGGDRSLPSLVQKNNATYGIPQGTPISDLIANIYLIDFDQQLHRWARKRGGMAFRYSDDIIVILPRVNGQPFDAAKIYLQDAIKRHGDRLKIQDKKVAIGRFIRTSPNSQVYTQIFGQASKNGLEYLGFEFDGTKVEIKDATLSNAWRKLKRRTYGWSKKFVKRYRARGDNWLKSNAQINFELRKIIRTVSFSEKDFRKWTFLQYIKRANRAFSGYNVSFHSQTKKYKSEAMSIMIKAFDKAVARHGYDACIRRNIPL